MVARLSPLLLALLAALLLHALGWFTVAAQITNHPSALRPQNDPLFTRTIAVAAPAKIQTAAPPPRAKSATSISASVTPTAPERPPPSAETAPTQTQETAAQQEPSSATDANATANEQPATPADPEGALSYVNQWPSDTRVSYAMSGFFNGELHGSGQVQWTRSGANADEYQVRVAIDAGIVELRLTSQGRVSANGLLPHTYEESTKAFGRDARLRTLKLEEQEIIFSDGRRVSRPPQEPLAVQDSVSQFIDLGHRFQQGRDKLQAGEIIRIWLGRPGGLDQWTYDVQTAQSMELPRIGAISVFALKPRPLSNPRGTIAMTLWLAPSLQYLPAKIRIDLDSKNFVELIAERIEQR